MVEIKNLYETHLEVADLDRSVAFYEKLGLVLMRKTEQHAFFRVGEGQMLGLWVEAGQPVAKRHFAFGVELGALMEARQFLMDQEIPLDWAFGKEPIEPVVHTWMPAASIYFVDPDGNSLEYIAELPYEPVEEPLMYLSEFMELQKVR